MQELRENITTLSNANDAQTSKLELLEQTQHDLRVTRESERINDYNIKRVILKAFGWEQATADPTLLHELGEPNVESQTIFTTWVVGI